MKHRLLQLLFLGLVAASQLAWRAGSVGTSAYRLDYAKKLDGLRAAQDALLRKIARADISTEPGRDAVRASIRGARRDMKRLDFWMRYLEPLAQKRVNGPLPVEWETEVFEKFEKPYKREGAGLTLARLTRLPRRLRPWGQFAAALLLTGTAAYGLWFWYLRISVDGH